VPADRVRAALCWGNYEGPHHLDIGVEKIIDSVLQRSRRRSCSRPPTRATRTSGRCGETRRSRRQDPRPGVLDTTANFIEHPELVAQRIETFADIVGPDRVMAGTDCGFGTWAGFGRSTGRSAGPSSAPWPRAPRSASQRLF
jgi:5-methyltetrahydropteroyltriglutamate--homocysteine methyltransferase